MENGKGVNDFNGHFWVELPNGEIIDDCDWNNEINDFKNFFSIQRQNAVLEYDRCDNLLTNVASKTFTKRFDIRRNLFFIW